ncbi:right-handed parallel beta-helix repeat-containing protein [Kineococcus rhizosphaerae]|uniref:Parallel beta helix pectate lyase-like protein n=1 Tax=Kineococcus rhizosphaerae TaxID=559628 RepID=A0A2T0R100_9ACTN|nr:right-handed parallel beta-helix repeat-containing protein [Kineococcus rhizosphaerae]PRY12959.1 parallel beta helix pectate lyase-like protein [Kineococcus rhizosphaerae]
MFTARRTLRTTLAVLGTAAVIGSAALPADAASTSTWIAYAGTSVNNARVPASSVSLTVRSPQPFDTVSFLVGGKAVSGTGTATLGSDGDWVSSAAADLSGYSGRISLTARLTRGKASSSIAKTLRVVDPASTLGSGSTGTSQRPTRAVRTQYGDGRPGAFTTGLRGGADPARVLTGDQTITTAGTVLDGVTIKGCLVVKASNVTVRNSKVVCHAPGRQLAVNVGDGVTGFVVEDSEIDATGTDVGIGWGNYTLRRVNVHGSADGARFGTNVTIEDSWIHDMSRADGLHSDAVQTTSGANVVIRHNTLDPSSGGDPLNSAVMIGTETGQRALKNVLVEKNFLGGGSYTLNVRGDVNVSGLVVRGNTFDDNSRYGAMIVPNGKDITVSGNTMGWTGKEVTADRW